LWTAVAGLAVLAASGVALASDAAEAPWAPVPFERIERVPRVFDYMF